MYVNDKIKIHPGHALELVGWGESQFSGYFGKFILSKKRGQLSIITGAVTSFGGRGVFAKRPRLMCEHLARPPAKQGQRRARQSLAHKDYGLMRICDVIGGGPAPETGLQPTNGPWFCERDGWVHSSPRREKKPPQAVRGSSFFGLGLSK